MYVVPVVREAKPRRQDRRNTGRRYAAPDRRNIRQRDAGQQDTVGGKQDWRKAVLEGCRTEG